jgi:putative SOS response-associated peptidase YedK
VCASYQARLNVAHLVEWFARAGAPLDLPGGLPNLEPQDEVRPTNGAPVVLGTGGVARLATQRFGFPPPKPKAGPIINLRAEGRTFLNRERTGRCLVPVSGFYEFTGSSYPKTRWMFRDAEAPFLALAAVWRAGEGDAFSLLTTEPGPDVAPYHTRGVIPVAVERWADWLFAEDFPADIIAPPPAGRLVVEAAPRNASLSQRERA